MKYAKLKVNQKLQKHHIHPRLSLASPVAQNWIYKANCLFPKEEVLIFIQIQTYIYIQIIWDIIHIKILHVHIKVLFIWRYFMSHIYSQNVYELVYQIIGFEKSLMQKENNFGFHKKRWTRLTIEILLVVILKNLKMSLWIRNWHCFKVQLLFAILVLVICKQHQNLYIPAKFRDRNHM